MRYSRRAVAVVLSLGVAACDGPRDMPSPPPSTPPSSSAAVTIGYSALRISLPVFVAEQRGIFRRHGLDVTLRRYDTAQPLAEEVLDGRVDAGGYAALPIIMTAVSRGGAAPRLTTALIEDAEHPISRLLKKRGDASLTTVADLRGKRIGILPTIAYRRWLDAVLHAAGLAASDVSVMPLAPPQQAAALADGAVDALFTNDPMATAMIARGVGELFGDPAPVPAALGGEVRFGSFLIGAGFAREHADVAARLVAALDEAIGSIEADQRGARRAMAPYVRPEERAFIESYPDARYLTSSQATGADLQREIDAMARLGILDAPMHVEGWVLASPRQAP